MNVFVLCTGRCGSTTFARACEHVTNFTSGHETRTGYLGEARFAYPENHIEADNRLSWFLGRLEKAYGDNAFYVHLTRRADDVAHSLTRRYDEGIMRSYRNHMLQGWPENEDPAKVCLDFCETVNTNIELFLHNKPNKMLFTLESAEEDFKRFWQAIDAKGDLPAALSEWSVTHNVSASDSRSARKTPFVRRASEKVSRIAKKMPEFIRKA